MAAVASDWLRQFRLLFWNRWTEFNETWQKARSQCPLPSLCFSGRWDKQDGRPGLWLAETFSTSHLKLLNRIQRNLTGSKISVSSTKFVFFGPIRKTRWPPLPLIGWDILDFSSETAKQNLTRIDRKQDLNVLYRVCVFRADQKNKMAPWPLIGWDIFDFSSETAEQNSTKLDRKQDVNVLLQVCVFQAIGKTRWLPWYLIGWHIFDFSSETAERNSTKLDRKQDLNVLYQVCVFRADGKNKMVVLTSDWLRHFWLFLWKHWMDFNATWQGARSQHPLPSCVFQANRKNKMAALVSDWLTHFRLLLWNGWTEFNETGQEARSQCPLPRLCFSGRWEKQDGRPGLWFAETFSTFPLKAPNGFQRNLTGSKISTSSTKFVFCGQISKQKGLPWSIPLKGGTLYPGARYVAFGPLV